MRLRALACVALAGAATPLALCHCDRGAAPAPAPAASASTATVAQRWVDVLDPRALGTENLTPEVALRALAERRKAGKPLADTVSSKNARDKATLLADKLLERGYSLRKNPIWKPKPPIDWGHNPQRDSNWHYNVNSLRPMKPLIEAYAAGAGDRYLDLARHVALDWIDFNMVRKRPNEKKWHDMGSALRAQVLATVLDLELRRSQPDTRAVGLLVWALDEHATFLADPKVFTLGNHGFFMMRGLSWILRGLPELENRPRLDRYMTEQMKRLLSSQFARDGLHLEHSPGYHNFITKSFSNALAEGSFPELVELRETVARAKTHFTELRHPNGDVPMLGDTKRVGAKVPDAGASASAVGGPLRGYPESGWAVFRTHFGEKAAATDDYLLLGAGHHSSAHKHADHLSFEWSFRGIPVLIDSGLYTYDRDEWRQFFTSTRAGNAVEVDESDYATRLVKGKGNSKLSAWGQVGDAYYIVAEQRDRALAVAQTRVLVLSPARYLLIVDRMQSKRKRRYRQWFHFHESLAVEQRGGLVSIGDGEAGPLLTLSELGGGAHVELVRGQTKPRIQGFVSADYLKKTPRFSLAFRKRGTKAAFAALFSADKVRAVQFAEAGDGFSVAWRDDRGPQRFQYTPGAAPPVTSSTP